MERKKNVGSNYPSQTVTSYESLTPILFNTYIRVLGPQGRKKSPLAATGGDVMES